MSKYTVNAMIPARLGSVRIKFKNLRLLNGHPLIYYTGKACKEAGIFHKIIVNSESEIFSKMASRYELDFYHRPRELGSSQTKSDEVVYDFIKNNPSDIIYWVNPTSPLQAGVDMKIALDHFKNEKLDTLFTIQSKNIHTLYDGNPLNFKDSGLFPRSQDLVKVGTFVFSFMMWRTSSFIKSFEEKGHAFFCGKVGYFEVDNLASIDIDNEEDFLLAEYIIKFQNQSNYTAEYDELYNEHILGTNI